MIRYIALLRGINVSGQKLIKMEELRKHFELPGFGNIVSYIQSGNVLFDTKEKNESVVRKLVEDTLSAKLGYHVPAIVRSIDNIRQVIKNNPFDMELSGPPNKLYVTFLSDEPTQENVATLHSFVNENEVVHVSGRDIYFSTPAYGETKLSNTLIEKKLRVTATTRNWATVTKVTTL